MSPEFSGAEFYQGFFEKGLTDPQFREWQNYASEWLERHYLLGLIVATPAGLEISVQGSEDKPTSWIARTNINLKAQYVDTTHGMELTSGLDNVPITHTFGKILKRTGRFAIEARMSINQDLVDDISLEDGASAMAYVYTTSIALAENNFGYMIEKFVEAYYSFMKPTNPPESFEE